jgi:ubiquinone/menaquinone biosynthesis C-methylase UbiE
MRVPRLLLLALLATVATSSAGRAEDPGDESVLGFLAPRRGETIADVGCGRGVWTFPLARTVGPTGRILAVDIKPEYVREVRRRAEEEGVANVEVIQSVPDDPKLPEERVDAVLLNDVIDWVERPALAGFLAGIRDALKPGGRLVIRDPNGGADRVIAELYRSGFALIEARVPLDATPSRSFSTGWYALKLRRAEIQPAVLPRLGRPARYGFRLHLAEELFREGLVGREELGEIWRRVRDRPGAFDPETGDAKDLIRAAAALDVLEPAEVETLRARLDDR